MPNFTPPLGEGLEVRIENVLALFPSQDAPASNISVAYSSTSTPAMAAQIFRRVPVHHRAGGGERKASVSDKMAEAHEARDLPGRLDAALLIHLVDDRGRAAHGLVAEIDRRGGLQAAAQAVVVDDLQHFGLGEALHGLARLVVVHHGSPAFSAGPSCCAGRSCRSSDPRCPAPGNSVAHLNHDFLHILHRRFEVEGQQLAWVMK